MTHRSILLALGVVAAMLVGGPALAADPHGDDHGSKVDPIHHVVDANYLEIPWPNAHLAKSIHLPHRYVHVGAPVRASPIEHSCRDPSRSPHVP